MSEIVVEISEISELHYITHIDNLKSILQYGILCHKDAQKHNHVSVADKGVQARRAKKQVPGGLPLHHYANLYVNARNPMLYRNCQEYTSHKICVLQISKQVMFLPDVVISDGNAATGYTSFSSSPDGIKKINKSLVFAKYWNGDDPIIKSRKTWAICAEVLVPHKIAPEYVIGIFCSSTTVVTSLTEENLRIPVEINLELFFENEQR